MLNAVSLEHWYWPVGQALEFSELSYGMDTVKKPSGAVC